MIQQVTDLNVGFMMQLETATRRNARLLKAEDIAASNCFWIIKSAVRLKRSYGEAMSFKTSPTTVVIGTKCRRC